MSYHSALAQIGLDYRAEIEAELVASRTEYEAALAALEESTKRIHILEGVLNLPKRTSVSEIREHSATPAKRMTLHAAMREVLQAAPTGKLRAGEIIAEIERLGLYRMKDGRLPESQQIHARANHYPKLFGKDGSHFYAK